MLDIRRTFHQQLDAISSDIVRLAALTTEFIPRGTDVLLAGDLKGADDLIMGDDELDALSVDIEERCYQLLALQQPMARDLRAIVTAIRLVSEIERSADLMVNVAKGARRMYGKELDPAIRGYVVKMSEQALRLYRHAIDAYVERDDSLAAALDDMDDDLDQVHAEFIQAIFRCHSQGNLDLPDAVQLALIGRYYERIGDHAVNIGERVRYMVTGWLPEHIGAARAAARAEPDGDGEGGADGDAAAAAGEAG